MTPERAVSFSSVLEVRTYNVTLGDHPCCSGGMALTCDWDHSGSELVDLEVFEAHSLKRRKEGLRLNYGERRQRLVETTGLSTARLLQIEYELMCQEQGQTSDCHINHKSSLHRSMPSMHLQQQGDV